MAHNFQKGEIVEAVMVLVVLSIILFVFIIPSKRPGPLVTFSTYSTGNYGDSPSAQTTWGGTVSTGSNVPASYYSDQISLTSGNASSATQSYEEYITIQNNSGNPVDITGWRLENAKGSRTYVVGTSDAHFPSDSAIIPKAAGVLSSQGPYLTDVILKPGETATVTTGVVGNRYPFPITSFKENECTGYLADTNTYNYTFSPGFTQSCISPSEEPGAASLDRTCKDFLQGVQMCSTPKINALDAMGNTVDSQGNVCNGCVNGVAGLSTSCRTFIQSHLSYPSCVTQHINDPNFYGSTWHIFLGRGWEMWAQDHETIYLYDTTGKLVASQSY